MFARTTTFHPRPGLVGAGVTYVRDAVMPVVKDIRGCVGTSMLVENLHGRCVVTAAWQSEEAMHANAQRVLPLREQAEEIFGSRMRVDEWQIAVLHRRVRSHEGACVRAAWVRVAPVCLDHAIDVHKTLWLPALGDLEGFCSASLFVNRASGRAVSSVTFDGQQAMERNRAKTTRISERTDRSADAEVLDVSEFGLALAHLHVPEMV